MEKEKIQNFQNLMTAKSAEIFPGFQELPTSDPMKILTEFIAVASAAVEKKIDELPQTIALQLPGIFGLSTLPAKPSQALVQFQLSPQCQDEVLLPEGTELLAEGQGAEILFRTSEAGLVANLGAVEIQLEREEIYLGLDRIPDSANLILYFQLERNLNRRKLSWSILSGEDWKTLSVLDSTEGLAKSGLIRFFTSQLGFSKSVFEGREKYWIRARSESNLLDLPLRSVNTNVIPVINLRSFPEFCVGSGSGLKNQSFDLPEGETVQPFGVRIFDGEAGKIENWMEVQTFFLSRSDSKHWIFDPRERKLQFGDGRQGRVAPPGYDNIWIDDLVLCDGVKGNLPKAAKIRLKSEDWRIQKVEFFTEASGGVNRIVEDDLLQTMHHSFRNKDRAITLSDFREIALRANSRIGKVYAREIKPFTTKLIILLRPDYARAPELLDFSPFDSDLDSVKSFLDSRRTLNSELVIQSPEYRDVTVRAHLFVKKLNMEVRLAIEQVIRDFFSPYATNGMEIYPGVKIYRSKLVKYLERCHYLISLRSISMEDRRSGLTQEVISLGADELARLHLDLQIEEASL